MHGKWSIGMMIFEPDAPAPHNSPITQVISGLRENGNVRTYGEWEKRCQAAKVLLFSESDRYDPELL
jgi:hypothetical protein